MFDVVAREAGQHAAFVQRAPVAIRHVTAVREANVDEFVRRARIGHRQQQFARQAEDQRVGADADADRRGGGEDQQRLLEERSKAIAQVLRQVLDERDAARVAAGILDRRDRPEPRRASARAAAGLMPFAISARASSSRCIWISLANSSSAVLGGTANAGGGGSDRAVA